MLHVNVRFDGLVRLVLSGKKPTTTAGPRKSSRDADEKGVTESCGFSTAVGAITLRSFSPSFFFFYHLLNRFNPDRVKHRERCTSAHE
jgi:hypothetical protein